MNDQDSRKRNRKVGIILCLLFVGLFTITTLGLVLGFEASPPVKKIVSWTTTVIAGVIGIFLIGAAIIEIIIKTGLVSFIVKLVKRGYQRVRR